MESVIGFSGISAPSERSWFARFRRHRRPAAPRRAPSESAEHTPPGSACLQGAVTAELSVVRSGDSRVHEAAPPEIRLGAEFLRPQLPIDESLPTLLLGIARTGLGFLLCDDCHRTWTSAISWPRVVALVRDEVERRHVTGTSHRSARSRQLLCTLLCDLLRLEVGGQARLSALVACDRGLDSALSRASPGSASHLVRPSE